MSIRVLFLAVQHVKEQGPSNFPSLARPCDVVASGFGSESWLMIEGWGLLNLGPPLGSAMP